MKSNGMDKKNNRKSRRVRRTITLAILAGLLTVTAVGILILVHHRNQEEKEMARVQQELLSTYGENQKIEENTYDRELAVVCGNGIFVGKKEGSVCSYKGIPYALPPVGELRWKKPVPAETGQDVYEAFYFGKSGIQTKAETERASLYPQGEDCLTLNVWTAGPVSSETEDAVSSGRPVMVFFHGGGYGWGGTADPLYDGQNFVEKWQDIVLVTVNYRIGLMGFMDFSKVEGGEEFAGSGNLGMLDQVCALEWIRDNIAGFGGDPDQVTIFGESAGGSNVSLLPLMKEAKGLFKRCIAQSGTVAFTYSREESQSLTEKLLKETGAQSMDDLMALSEEELMKVNESLNDYNNFPERDGIILPEDLYEAYQAGEASDVDMLIGSNADEARYWIGEVGGYGIYRIAGSLLYKSTRMRIAPQDRHYIRDFMRLQKDKTIWNRTEFMNELLFRIPAVAQAEAHAESGGNTYMYYWTKESAIPYYGACHAVELAYVFNNPEDTIFTGEIADAGLSEEVQEMWVNFARTGNPSTEKYEWKPYDSRERNTMFLGEEIRLVSDPMPEQRELIQPLLSYRINGYYGIYDYAVKYVRKEIMELLIRLLVLQGVILGVYLGTRIIRKRRKG